MSPLPRPTRRRSSRAARPSWADHVPRRRLSDRLPTRVRSVSPSAPVVRRSAVAVLAATALIGGGYAVAVVADPERRSATVLGLTANGTCDNRKAARQHAAATATRDQARALLTDLALSDDPADHALAGQITDLGFRPATESVGWRQHAVDVSDQLHHLNSTDPQVQEVGVRLAAAGLGPTPADLVAPPPAADLAPDTAGAGAAVGALDQARSAVTAPAAPVERAEQPPPAAPPVPAACTAPPHPAPAPAPPGQPPAEKKTAQLPGPAGEPAAPAATAAMPAAVSPPTTAPTTTAAPRPASGSGEKTGAFTTGSSQDDDSQVAADPAAPTAASSSNRVVTDVQTGPGRAPAAEDTTTARAAIGMVTDLLSAIRADGSGDATQVGATVLDALDRDRLAALGADPADLDALDQLRTTTDNTSTSSTGTGSTGTGSSSGGQDGGTEVSGEQTTAPGPTPNSTPDSTPDSETSAETSVAAVGPRPGAAITRTQTSRNGTTTSTTTSGGSGSGSGSGSGDDTDGNAGGGAGGRTVSSSAGAVSAGIEKLTAQARAAAEVDPVAQDLLDALNRTTTTGPGAGAGAGAGAKDSTKDSTDKSGRAGSAERGPGPVSTAAGTGAGESDPVGERAGDEPVSSDVPAGAVGDRGGAAGDQPRRAAVGAEPPPVTDGGVATAAAGSTWDKLAQCEAGGDWSTDTGNGFKGGLQFSPSTWRAFGGEGEAHEASREEQIEVAKRVQAVQGWQAWPTCSKRLELR